MLRWAIVALVALLGVGGCADAVRFPGAILVARDLGPVSGPGGWRTTFDAAAGMRAMLHVRGRGELRVSVDGAPVAALARAPDGRGGQLLVADLGTLGAGPHVLAIGGASGTVLIDDVVVTDAGAGARAAVARLDFGRFKDNIRTLADFGDRTQGTASNAAAARWLDDQLRAAGYTVERHRFTYQGRPRESVYATKVGAVFPDHMYIVSAHLDGIGGGGAANDDASGCSLVLEVARALAPASTAVSVRFIFWSNEETGLNGSTAYVNERARRQGIDEPRWLGIIQHDQILFDHGLPPQPAQIPEADIDVEYQAASERAAESLKLATALRAGSRAYATGYPAEIGADMNYTDSVPFQDHTAAVSVRDNQRIAEIGRGSHPHWHQPSDVYATYGEADFRLGFSAVQMTLGTVAELAGARRAPARP